MQLEEPSWMLLIELQINLTSIVHTQWRIS